MTTSRPFHDTPGFSENENPGVYFTKGTLPMKKHIFSLVCLVAFGFFFLPKEGHAESKSQKQTTTNAITFPPAGEVTILKDQDAKRLLTTHGKRLLVVNYWATWCAPCVAELPYFVEAHEKYKNQDVLIVGLSLDFLHSWKKSLLPFLQKKKIPYPNFVLDVDPNTYITAISPAWSGSLPATFYYDNEGRKLGEQLGAVEKEDLFQDIEKYLKQTKPSTKTTKEAPSKTAPNREATPSRKTK